MGAKQIGVTNEAAYRAYDRLLWAERERCDDLAEAIEQFTYSLIDDDVDLDSTDVVEVARATYQGFRLAYATILGAADRLDGEVPPKGMNPWVPHTEDI